MMSDIMFEHLTKTYPNGFISVDDVTLKFRTENLSYFMDRAAVASPRFFG